MFRTTKPYYITMGIAFLAMVLVIVFSNITSGSSNKELDEQVRQIQVLENEIAVKSAEISAGNANIANKTLGLDMERGARDDESARSLLTTLTTWNNYEQYAAARLQMVDTYGLPTTGRFLTTFFPEYPDVKSPEGEPVNFIDAYKLSCAYRGMKSMIRGSENGVYSYFTIVTCSGNKDGSGSNFNLAVMYTIDESGRVYDFDAYTLDGYVWVDAK